MTWALLLELTADERGPEAANRAEARALAELAGLRLWIALRPVLTPDRLPLVEQVKPKEAARRLGVHVSTLCRRQRRGAFGDQCMRQRNACTYLSVHVVGQRRERTEY